MAAMSTPGDAPTGTRTPPQGEITPPPAVCRSTPSYEEQVVQAESGAAAEAAEAEAEPVFSDLGSQIPAAQTFPCSQMVDETANEDRAIKQYASAKGLDVNAVTLEQAS